MENTLQEISLQLDAINSSLTHQNWWTIFIPALFTLLTGFIALAAAFGAIQRLYKPKQKILTGDKIEIVTSGNTVFKIHIPLTIINMRFYPISVNKIVCIIRKGRKEYMFNWDLFVKPHPNDGLVCIPEKRPAPFAVKSGSNINLEIQFSMGENENLEISKGEYIGELQMWSGPDCTSIEHGPTEREYFSFSINEKKLEDFNSAKAEPGSHVVLVQIQEWTVGWEKNI